MAILHKSLVKHGFNAVCLHGDMEQSARTAALDKFRKGEADLLIASDVAARGLDIPDVSHVFNFDVPHHPDDYVHRIGRTGRAGKSGVAITIASPADQKSVAAIEKLTGQPIEASNDAEFDPTAPQPEARRNERSSGKSRGAAAKAGGKVGITAKARSTAKSTTTASGPSRCRTGRSPRRSPVSTRYASEHRPSGRRTPG